MGGWQQVKKAMKGIGRVKGDERILGDSDFVLNVLVQSNEKMERGFQLYLIYIFMDVPLTI